MVLGCLSWFIRYFHGCCRIKHPKKNKGPLRSISAWWEQMIWRKKTKFGKLVISNNIQFELVARGAKREPPKWTRPNCILAPRSHPRPRLLAWWWGWWCRKWCSGVKCVAHNGWVAGHDRGDIGCIMGPFLPHTTSNSCIHFCWYESYMLWYKLYDP